MSDPEQLPSGSDPTGSDPGAPEVDAAAFWAVGPLPPPADGDPDPVPWPALAGRPEITVDGRNLADVLAPLYRALTDPRG